MIIPIEKPGTPEELVHYGVKGMRWGVRKQEETSNRKSAQKLGPVRQKLIKYHKFEVKSQQERIDYVNAHPSKWRYVQNQNIKEVRQREKIRDQHLEDIKNLKEGKLTDFQKKALIGAGIAATVLIAYGAYRLHDAKARRYIQEGDKIIGISFKRNDLLSRKMTSQQIMDEVVSKVNPGKGPKIYGRRNNCLRCSFAYELRRRGYDVEATSTSRGGFEQTAIGVARALSGAGQRSVTSSPLGEHQISLWSSGKEVLDRSPERARITASHILDALSQHDEGARGELGVAWRMGGAHSLAWEVIGGKAHIFDTQLGKHFRTPEEFLKYAKEISAASYTRLDDIDLNENFLMREWIQNVK